MSIGFHGKEKLELACEQGNLEQVKILCETMVVPNIKKHKILNICKYCIMMSNNVEIVKFLCERYLSNRKDIEKISHNILDEYYDYFNRGLSLYLYLTKYDKYPELSTSIRPIADFFSRNKSLYNEDDDFFDSTIQVIQYLINFIGYYKEDSPLPDYINDFLEFPAKPADLLVKSAIKR
jgi:hypothetical protein